MAALAILGAVVSSERTEKNQDKVQGLETFAEIGDGPELCLPTSSFESFGPKQTDVVWLQASPVYIVLSSVTPSVRNQLKSRFRDLRWPTLASLGNFQLFLHRWCS